MDKVCLHFQNKTWTNYDVIMAIINHMLEPTDKKSAWKPKCLYPNGPDNPRTYEGIIKLFNILKTFTKKVEKDHIIEIPAGRVKKDQHYLDAIVEEAFEESGFIESREFFEKHFVGFTPSRKGSTTAVFKCYVNKQKRTEQWKRVYDRRHPDGFKYWKCPHSYYKHLDVDQKLAKREKSLYETTGASWLSLKEAKTICDSKSKVFLDVAYSKNTVKQTDDIVTGVAIVFECKKSSDIQIFIGDRHIWNPQVKHDWESKFWGEAPYQVYTI